MADVLRVCFVIDPHYSSYTPSSRKDDFAEAMLTKTRFLAEESHRKKWDAFVIAGDVFTTATISFSFLVELVSVFQEFRDECRMFVVAGNHDMRHRQLSSIRPSPLGVLFETGVLENMEELKDGSWGPLVGMHYRDHVDELPDFDGWNGHKWLVCHQYVGREPSGFEGATDCGWLLYDKVDEHKFTGVVAGHDHVPYEPATTPGGATVFRFGALSRGTKHGHNLDRVPQVMEVEFYSGGGLEVSNLRVPAESDVFLQSALMATERNEELKKFVSAIGSDAFKQEQDTSAVVALRAMEKEDGVDGVVIKKIEEYFETFGIL